MSQSILLNYMHIVFSTKNRTPWLRDRNIREAMYAYLAGSCNERKWPALKVGGYEDHIHLLIRLGKKDSVPQFIGLLKEYSSKWIKTKGSIYSGFYWQAGYGAFGVCASHMDAVLQYIATQEEHHQNVSFQDEYRRILKKNGADYDERYVWD